MRDNHIQISNELLDALTPDEVQAIADDCPHMFAQLHMRRVGYHPECRGMILDLFKQLRLGFGLPA